MIDWTALVRDALWIVGLSVALATWSYASWQAGVQQTSLRLVLGRPSFRMAIYLGLALSSAGFAWGATRTWELLAWTILAALFLGQAVRGLCARARSGGN